MRQILVEEYSHGIEKRRRSRCAAKASAALISSAVKSGKSARISSSDIPPARYSRISVTVIRVPRITGLPLRMPGSITIRARSPFTVTALPVVHHSTVGLVCSRTSISCNGHGYGRLRTHANLARGLRPQGGTNVLGRLCLFTTPVAATRPSNQPRPPHQLLHTSVARSMVDVMSRVVGVAKRQCATGPTIGPIRHPHGHSRRNGQKPDHSFLLRRTPQGNTCYNLPNKI